MLVNLSGFCILFSTYRSFPPPPTCPLPPPMRGNSCRQLTTDSLSSKETFSPKHFLLKWYFSVTFDPSPTAVKREHRQEKSLLPQFQHLGTFIFEKGKGKAALLEAASLGAPGFQRWGEKGLLSGRRQDVRRSGLALRTVCFPLVSFLSLCWFLQPGFAQAPWPQGLSHKAAAGRNRSPSSASSRPPRSTPSTCLPPSGPHSRASTGGGVFLGTTWMHLHLSPQAFGPATDPPPRTAPGSRQAGSSQPSLLRPGWPPRALLSRCCLQRQSPLASSP